MHLPHQIILMLMKFSLFICMGIPWASLKVIVIDPPFISSAGLLIRYHILLLSQGNLFHLSLASFEVSNLFLLKKTLPLKGLASLVLPCLMALVLLALCFLFLQSSLIIDVIWRADHLGCSLSKRSKQDLKKRMYQSLFLFLAWAIFFVFIPLSADDSSNSLTLISSIREELDPYILSIFQTLFQMVVFWLVLPFIIPVSPFCGVERGWTLSMTRVSSLGFRNLPLCSLFMASHSRITLATISDSRRLGDCAFSSLYRLLENSRQAPPCVLRLDRFQVCIFQIKNCAQFEQLKKANKSKQSSHLILLKIHGF